MSISVIIPAYNAQDFIQQAINSVISQQLGPDEIIVIDDGSTDKTRDIVKSFGGMVDYHFQENAGSGKARNFGIYAASSEYIAFLDSDDYWESMHLAMMQQLLYENPHACLAYCGKKWVDKDGNLMVDAIEQKCFPAGWIFNDMFDANYISTSSVVIARKSALLAVGGFDETPESRNAQDYHLWLRMSAMYPVASSPQKTVNYRVHDANTVRNVVSRQRGLMYALESARILIEKGMVDKNNKPDQINISKRMQRQYNSSVMSLYYARQYQAVREFCLHALKQGYWSSSLLVRYLLAILPPPLRTNMHSLRKRTTSWLQSNYSNENYK